MGGFFQEIFPLRGSILQAGTCQILSLAEYPKWSRVWQYAMYKTFLKGSFQGAGNWQNVLEIVSVNLNYPPPLTSRLEFLIQTLSF